MASSQKGKKVVNQEDLRRFMKEKKLSSERQKRVESPLAKYNSLGQLSCALCNAPVRSALLWQTHVLGKQHKDKVSQLKNRDSAEAPAASSSSSSSSAPKRPAPELASTSGKRAKLTLTGGAGAAGGQPEETAASSRQSAGLGLLAGLYGGGDDDDDEEAKDGVPAAGLPVDFFDSSVSSAPPAVSHSGSVSKPDDGEESTVERKDHAAEALPEGFFDDPVRDAKVRQVDTPRDQMDKEWEEFQKEMRQVNTASDAIVAEDDEEGRLERQIDEINEQIECFRRVEVLRTKQEVKSAMERERRQRAEAQPHTEEEEEEDEEELMHVLAQDWRAKGALA